MTDEDIVEQVTEQVDDETENVDPNQPVETVAPKNRQKKKLARWSCSIGRYR
jgi:hypothetical protein